MRTVEIVDPCTDPRWEALASSGGSLFESPPWCRVISEAFGISIRGALLIDRGVPRCGLLVGDINDAIGRRQSTLPFADFCGPIGVSNLDEWQSLTDALLDPSIPYALRLRAHPIVAQDARLRETTRYVWHKVDLGETREQALARVSRRTRQGIRTAERKGVTVSHRSNLDCVLEFHEMHSELRQRKYEMLAQPESFFRLIHREFAATGNLCVTEGRLDGVVVAACFLLRWGNRTYYKFNTSRTAGQLSNANDLTLWEAFNFAREVWKSDAVDLGLSGLDQPGLLAFKTKHATHADDLIAYSMGTESAESAATRRLINEMTALFVEAQVPSDVRDRAAGILYRHFS